MAKSVDVCQSTCSKSCPRPKSSSTEQQLLHRVRLELLQTATDRPWGTFEYQAYSFEDHIKRLLDGVDPVSDDRAVGWEQDSEQCTTEILNVEVTEICKQKLRVEYPDLPPSPTDLASTRKTEIEDPANATPSKFNHSSEAFHVLETFRDAVSQVDSMKVNTMLEQSFEKVAIQEYSWLSELRKLGYSPGEIGSELLEASRDKPWIFSEFEVPESQPFSPGFHIKNCLHSNRTESNQNLPFERFSRSISTAHTSEHSIREKIEYFCGIGGVSPSPTGVRETQFGSVVFKDSTSTAIVTLRSLSEADGAASSICSILAHLEHAIGVLQRIQGCCNSFTFLSRGRVQGVLELHRVDLLLVRNFIRAVETQASEGTPVKGASITELISQMFPYESHKQLLSPPLLAQFLCLTFLSYSQAHCGTIRPFFLDTPLQRIVLIGDKEWHEKFQGPCIIASLKRLTCFGDMLREPVFAFELHRGYGHNATASEPKEYDLLAEPEDLLDTWGPGELVVPKQDPNKICAISIGGGFVILPQAENGVSDNKLHWSPASTDFSPRSSDASLRTLGNILSKTHILDKSQGRKVREQNLPPGQHDIRESTRGRYKKHSQPTCETDSVLTDTTFPRSGKAIIGTRIFSKMKCNGKPQMQIQRASQLFRELGTFPNYWEISERQIAIGVQGGVPAIALLQFNQTWVKRKGLTKKSKLLAQRSLYISDLEELFGIQISVCTGIARRVRLRDLLAEVLPTYADALVTKPLLWESLLNKFNLITALREDDLTSWLGRLDPEHQMTFESLVFAVLFVLQDTGVDRDGQFCNVAFIQPGLPFQCFKLPCKKENNWTRIVEDSEDTATFAYMTTECLETDVVKCRGESSSWGNSTCFLCTAVSCCDDGPMISGDIAVTSTPWVLRDSESYLIGRSDAPLLVEVDRPDTQEEPQLLVSSSKIRSDILNRLYRRGRYGKPRKLREKRMSDEIAENVVVIANLK